MKTTDSYQILLELLLDMYGEFRNEARNDYRNALLLDVERYLKYEGIID